MKTNAVTVTALEGHSVIVVSENNESYGHIRVMQERMIADDRGWIRKKVLTALAPGTIEDLRSLDWKAGQEVIGKIVVKESLKPFNPKDPKRDEKIAGKTGIVCSADGQIIYRKTFFSFNPDTRDELVPHTNGEEIKRAYEALGETEKSGNQALEA